VSDCDKYKDHLTVLEQLAFLTIPHVKAIHRNRRTKAVVALAKPDGKDIGFSFKLHHGIGEWVVCCLTHLEAKRYAGSQVARSILQDPENFCQQCRDYLDPQKTELEC